jgi:hypothetical protein
MGGVISIPATGMGSGSDLAELSRALLDSRIRTMPIVDVPGDRDRDPR